MRRMGSVTAPGIAQATYDAAVAKLVDVSAWVDLTATITTACAGAATADPDSLAAGLTVTTTTGTFDGATVACNSFAWTTHTTTNDGHGEVLRYNLGTIASLITGYDPATHAVQIEACLVAAGTLNSTAPIVAILVAPNGALPTTARGCGFEVESSANYSPVTAMTATGVSFHLSNALNTATVLPRFSLRILPVDGSLSGGAKTIVQHSLIGTTAATRSIGAANDTGNTYTTGDTLALCLGQWSTTSGAISGLKIRFRARLITIANLDLSDLDLGCQA